MGTLGTKRLLLNPVKDEDLPVLYEWERTGDYLELVSSEERKNYHLRFLIRLRRSGKPIGVIYTFSYNKSDGWMFLNVFICEEYRRLGFGAEACIMLICHIFEHFPVHKMYCDAFAINTQSIAMMESAELYREGLLKGHRLYSGRRYDVVRFAVHQDNLPKLKSLLRHLKREVGGKV